MPVRQHGLNNSSTKNHSALFCFLSQMDSKFSDLVLGPETKTSKKGSPRNTTVAYLTALTVVSPFCKFALKNQASSYTYIHSKLFSAAGQPCVLSIGMLLSPLLTERVHLMLPDDESR